MVRGSALLPCVLAALLAIQSVAGAPTRNHVRRQGDSGLPSAQEILDALTAEEKTLLVDSGYDTNGNKILEVAEIQAILDQTNSDPYANAENNNNSPPNVENSNNNNSNDPNTGLTPEQQQAIDASIVDPNANQNADDPNTGLYTPGSDVLNTDPDASGAVDQAGVINMPPPSTGGLISEFNSDGSQSVQNTFNSAPNTGSNNAALPVSFGGNVGGQQLTTTPGAFTGSVPAAVKGKDRVEAAVKKIGSAEAPATGATRAMSTVDLSSHLQQFPKAGPISVEKPLKMGETLEGPCGLTLTIQKDQNLVINDVTGRVLWQTKTSGMWPWAVANDALQLRIHKGNLMLWSSEKPTYYEMWSANGSQKGTKAMLGPDGNLILIDDLSAVLWTSGVPKEDLCTDKKAETIKQQLLAGVVAKKA